MVVTVEETVQENEEVVGVAYRLEDAEAEKALDTLDFREKGGYSRHFVSVSLKGMPSQSPSESTIEDNSALHSAEKKDSDVIVKAFVYTGTKDNPNYATSEIRENPELMSEIIHRSIGPSGENKEYLFNLAQFIRSIELVDEHVFDLEQRVRNLENTQVQ